MTDLPRDHSTERSQVMHLAGKIGVKESIELLRAYAAREVTGEQLPHSATISDIQSAVCRRYRLNDSDMQSSRRSREVAWPRQIAMYLSRNLTPRSLPEIGRRFGSRDHTTVIHAIRAVTARRLADAQLDADIRAIEAGL